MKRAILMVMDSFGIGGAEDAAKFGDAGSDTLGHIAAACATGAGDRAGLRSGPLSMPNLTRLGLGRAAQASTGTLPPGLEAAPGARRSGATAGRPPAARTRRPATGRWRACR